MASCDIHSSTLTRHITLRVTGLNTLKLRLRCAGVLFRLGAWVAGVGIVIEWTRPLYEDHHEPS